MGLAVVVLLGAVVTGVLAGGRLSRLGALRLRARGLVVAALLAQLTGALLGGASYPAGLAVSAVLVAGFLALNRGLAGLGLVSAGLLANALVVVANGAMPVSLDAAARAGIGVGDLLLDTDPRHELSTPDTSLPLLGDVVPVPLPVRPEVVSLGDVLVVAGLAQLVVTGMRGARDVRGRPRRKAP